jgi:hypothetical protein
MSFYVSIFLRGENVMNYLTRTAAAAVLSTALLVAAVPAQARPVERHQTARPAVSWFDAALSWLSDFMVGAQPAAQTHRSPATKTDTPPPPPTGQTGGSGFGGMHPMCSPLIDPNGHCGGGTGG